ncbi:Uncharacterized protein PBTT_01996 [Plasmodiophora brassicae]
MHANGETLRHRSSSSGDGPAIVAIDPTFPVAPTTAISDMDFVVARRNPFDATSIATIVCILLVVIVIVVAVVLSTVHPGSSSPASTAPPTTSNPLEVFASQMTVQTAIPVNSTQLAVGMAQTLSLPQDNLKAVESAMSTTTDLTLTGTAGDLQITLGTLQEVLSVPGGGTLSQWQIQKVYIRHNNQLNVVCASGGCS